MKAEASVLRKAIVGLLSASLIMSSVPVQALEETAKAGVEEDWSAYSIESEELNGESSEFDGEEQSEVDLVEAESKSEYVFDIQGANTEDSAEDEGALDNSYEQQPEQELDSLSTSRYMLQNGVTKKTFETMYPGDTVIGQFTINKPSLVTTTVNGSHKGIPTISLAKDGEEVDSWLMFGTTDTNGPLSLQPGTYKLTVTCKSGNVVLMNMRYDIIAEVEGQLEVEPNRDQDHATNVEVNELMWGTLCSGGSMYGTFDDDYYHFSLSERSNVSFYIDGGFTTMNDTYLVGIYNENVATENRAAHWGSMDDLDSLPTKKSVSIGSLEPGDYTVWLSYVRSSSVSSSARENLIYCFRVDAEPDKRTMVPIPEALQGLTYTGKPQSGLEQSVTYKTLDSGTAEAVDAGDYEAQVALIDSANYMWSDKTNDTKIVIWSIAPADISQTEVKPIGNQTYDGKKLTPNVTLTFDGVELRNGIDYTVTYTNNVCAGTATATITGKGNFAGSRDTTFEIVPGDLFPDVKQNAWYFVVVNRAAATGLMSGYSNGTFGPDDKVTRGQVAVMLWNMAGKPKAGSSAKKFPDVKSGAYYEAAVKWASSMGVVNGFGDGTFGPDKNVTREQLATMLANYARRVGGLEVTGSKADYATMKDAGKVSSYAQQAVGWCFRNKILSGSNGNVKPQGNATRAEAAKMLVALYDLVNK